MRILDYWDRQTWPSLTVRLSLLPWSWRFIPFGYYDYSPRTRDLTGKTTWAGWWGVKGEWLFLEVDFGFNLPPFSLCREADA